MLLKTGPIKPGTIREAIVFRYWNQMRSAKLIECLLPILTHHKSEEVKTIYKQYVDLMMPTNQKALDKSVEDNQHLLRNWLSQDGIKLSEFAGDPNEVLPQEWASLVKTIGHDESIPVEWRGKKINYGRRKNKISSRTGSSSGRGAAVKS